MSNIQEDDTSSESDIQTTSFTETDGGTRVKKEKTPLRKFQNFLKAFQTDVSKSACNKWMSVFVFAFFILAVSGVLFGWAAILIVFLHEGVYDELCVPHENTTGLAITSSKQGLFDPHRTALNLHAPYPMMRRLYENKDMLLQNNDLNCVPQDLRFALMFIIAMVALHVTQLPLGWLLDWWKSRVQTLIGTAMVFIGALGFFLADSKTFDVYIPSAIFVTVGGFIYYLGVLPMASLYYPQIGTVVAIWSCAFDSSTLVFVLFLQASKYLNMKSNYIFAVYLIIPTIMTCMNIFWPYNREQERAAKNYEDTKDGDETAPTNFSDLPFSKQIISLEFLVCMIYYFHSFWLNAFIGGVEMRLNTLTDDSLLVDRYIEIMSWIFPASFVLSPGIGFLIDRGGVVFNVIIIQVLVYSFNAVLFVPQMEVQIATFVLFSITRSYFYSFVNSYFISTFGIGNFGKIYGVISCVSGVVNATSYLLFEIVMRLGGLFYLLDILQAVSNLITFLFLLHVILKKVRETKVKLQKYEKLEEEGEEKDEEEN